MKRKQNIDDPSTASWWKKFIDELFFPVSKKMMDLIDLFGDKSFQPNNVSVDCPFFFVFATQVGHQPNGK